MLTRSLSTFMNAFTGEFVFIKIPHWGVWLMEECLLLWHCKKGIDWMILCMLRYEYWTNYGRFVLRRGIMCYNPPWLCQGPFSWNIASLSLSEWLDDVPLLLPEQQRLPEPSLSIPRLCLLPTAQGDGLQVPDSGCYWLRWPLSYSLSGAILYNSLSLPPSGRRAGDWSMRILMTPPPPSSSRELSSMRWRDTL